MWSAAAGELLLKTVEQSLPAEHPLARNLGGAQAARRRDVFGWAARILHGERSVVHAEEAGAARLRVADLDVVRQRDLAIAGELGYLMSRHRPDRRERDGGVRSVAGVHE